MAFRAQRRIDLASAVSRWRTSGCPPRSPDASARVCLPRRARTPRFPQRRGAQAGSEGLEPAAGGGGSPRKDRGLTRKLIDHGPCSCRCEPRHVLRKTGLIRSHSSYDKMSTIGVGDIHGNLPGLADLLNQLAANLTPDDTVVFLGDYIDRAPNQWVHRCHPQLSRRSPASHSGRLDLKRMGYEGQTAAAVWPSGFPWYQRT